VIWLNGVEEEKFLAWNLSPRFVTDTHKSEKPPVFSLSCAAGQLELLEVAGILVVLLNFIVRYR
jgi:hypothetical protein